MADTNLSKLVESALSNLKNMTEADTVIGKPLEVAGGTTVIPVSKITVGFTSGGIDYMSKSNPDKAPNFGGGTGTGYVVTPIAFLVVDADGGIKLLNIGENADIGGGGIIGALAGLAEKAPELIEKTMQVFKKDKSGQSDQKDESENEGDSVTLNNEDMKNAQENNEQ